MAWSRVNPKDITMTTLSSLGAGPPEEEEEEDCGRGGWKGAVKSKRREERRGEWKDSYLYTGVVDELW